MLDISTDFFTLTNISSIASIVSLIISIYSMILIRTVNSRFRERNRKNRIKTIIDGVRNIPDDIIGTLGSAPISKIKTLGFNIPKGFFSARGRVGWKIWNAARIIVKDSKSSKRNDEDELTKLNDLKELLNDWDSYSEEII